MNGSTIKQPDWFFYPAWAVVSLVSMLVSWFATFFATNAATNWIGDTIQVNGQTRFTEDVLFLYVFFLIFCLLSGVFQFLLLRLYLPEMGGWVSATMAGCVLVFVMMAMMQRIIGGNFLLIWNGALAFASIGGLIGLSQWVFLRRRIPNAGWWVLAGILGWGLAVLGRFAAEVNGSALVQLFAAILPPAIVAGLAWWYLLGDKGKKESSLGGVGSFSSPEG